MKKRLLVPMLLVSASALTLSISAPVINNGLSLAPIVAQAQETVSLKVHYGAPHGTRSFASTVVLMQGDIIVDAFIDEFQFVQGEDWTGVPNAKDADGFGGGVEEGNILISKRADSEGYSAMMAENAGSTVAYADNLDAIQAAVQGKTVAEVEELIAEVQGLGEEGNISDVVSGATLVDAAGYLQTVVDAANEGMEFVGAEVDVANVELSQSVQAPHGTKSFAIVTVAHEGDTVVAAAMDEFQFLSAEDATGVPNADSDFGGVFNEGTVLASKLVNDEMYSAMMAENAGSTVTYADNMQAVLDFATGKTTAEIEEAIAQLQGLGEEEAIADVVTGATFVDTAGYLQAIVDTVNGVEVEAEVVEETEEEAEEEVVEEETTEEEATEEETDEAVTYTDGVYTGTADGHNGPLEVQVTVEGGVITAVEVLSHEETEGISDPAIADVPAAIVASNSTAVEIVSGATVSSEAIIAAVEAALADAQ